MVPGNSSGGWRHWRLAPSQSRSSRPVATASNKPPGCQAAASIQPPPNGMGSVASGRTPVPPSSQSSSSPSWPAAIRNWPSLLKPTTSRLLSRSPRRSSSQPARKSSSSNSPPALAIARNSPSADQARAEIGCCRSPQSRSLTSGAEVATGSSGHTGQEAGSQGLGIEITADDHQLGAARLRGLPGAIEIAIQQHVH